ncbi:MAG: response regulator transcription factor [Gammaproteobacteria bacterium]|nr:response regulator transcription factor [Gammaproteobacteria bacterium]
MRILVIEDEPLLRRRLEGELRAAGHVVDGADSGEEGLFLGGEYPVDVAVVDLGLPDVDGVEVIRRWRRDGLAFPIIILTARGRWQDKVAGLEAGADDYVVKPFQMEELMARLKALARRASGWTEARLRCGPIEVDTASQGVSVHGAPVGLTAYEYRLLEYIVLHAGEVLSKSVLTEHLYAEDDDRDSNVLEVLVGRLRRKLDPDGSLAPIETLRGRGYRLRLTRDTAGGG